MLPRRVRIGAEGDLGFLARSSQASPRFRRPVPAGEFWEIDLKEGADGAPLLAACFERRVALSHFDVADASLQDVFIALAGER